MLFLNLIFLRGVEHGVDRGVAPHQRFGISDAALAMAHREHRLDQSVTKRPRVNHRYRKSLRQIVAGLIYGGRAQTNALSAVFRYRPLACFEHLGKDFVLAPVI